MKWYYTVDGGHTHVRVFMNGGKCGDLCFRNEEFAKITACPDFANKQYIICVVRHPAFGAAGVQLTLINDNFKSIE